VVSERDSAVRRDRPRLVNVRGVVAHRFVPVVHGRRGGCARPVAGCPRPWYRTCVRLWRSRGRARARPGPHLAKLPSTDSWARLRSRSPGLVGGFDAPPCVTGRPNPGARPANRSRRSVRDRLARCIDLRGPDRPPPARPALTAGPVASFLSAANRFTEKRSADRRYSRLERSSRPDRPSIVAARASTTPESTVAAGSIFPRT
jgi:hypothetical protein